MKLTGVDFETQGDDAATTNVTEIGAIQVDWFPPGTFVPIPGEAACDDEAYRILDQYSTLVKDPDYPPQPEEIVELTGITDEMLAQDGKPRAEAFPTLVKMIAESDYAVAHNKNFDEVVFKSTCKALGLAIPATPWLCSMTDIEYPLRFRCRQLPHLCFDHGIMMDTTKNHRALYDVQHMMFLLAKYPLLDVIKYASESWVYFQAIFPPPFGATATEGLVGKTKAQKLGYGWEKARGDTREFPKYWVKRVKERHVEQERKKTEKLGLAYRVLDLRG